MNIFNKVTLEGMKKSRTRTIVTIIGVILSAAMITAVATFAVSLQNYMIKGATNKYGDWHVQFSGVNSSFVKKHTADKEVKSTITFDNIGYAKLKGGKNPNKPYVFIAGFNEKTFDTLPITLVSGRMPENSSEILVPSHVESNGGVRMSVGDTLSLSVGNRMDVNKNLNQNEAYISKENLVPRDERTYKVVGICERPSFEDSSAPGYTFITKQDPSLNCDNFSMFVTLKNPSKVHAYAKSTAKTQNYALNDNVLRFMGLSSDNMFNAFVYSVGCILVVIIMIGSVFLIYNSFNISLNERTHQFGILSSVGATARQLKNSVLFEGICIGAIGIPLGIIVGIGSVGIVISVVAKNFGNILYSNVPLSLTLSLPAIVAAAVISMVTILISAYIPAKKAANTPVMESIRQTNEVKVESKTVKTSKLSDRIYGLEGSLALKNFKRNKKRYRSIVLSLALSVVLFVSASAFRTSLKKAGELSAVNSDYDICFYTQDMDSSKMFQLYDKFKTAKGVYASSYQAIMTYSCSVKEGNFEDSYRKSAGYDMPDKIANLPMDIQFIKDSEYATFIKKQGLPVNEYTGKNAKMIAVAKFKKVDEAKNGKSKMTLTNMFKSRSMNFTMSPQVNGNPNMEQSKNINITFVDTYPIDPLPKNPYDVRPYTFMVVAPYELKEKFEAPGTHTNLGLTFKSKNSSKSVAEMENIIKNAKISTGYTMYNVNKILEQNRNTSFVVDVFTYVFVIMISLIATANVFNTISTNIKLRRRELAMLRSVGMSDHDFQKMMNFECAFYGIRALLFGLPIAAISSWLIHKGMTGGGADISFTFPWTSMAVSVVSVLFIVFITMLYSISKLKKENIIDALRDDIS